MKKSIFMFLTVLLCFPALTFAVDCSSSGTSIVYVNGIETAQKDADNDMQSLHELLINNGNPQNIIFFAGYNPSHLDGAGDILESITQAFNAPISDFDLDTILNQLATELSTRKVLLIGHSQGTFYTNEMYDYLVKSGVSPHSIAVYNLATPADHVEGGGIYLTSANDKAINYVREVEAEGNAPQALPANIIIPEESGYTDNAWGGHYPDVYFNGAPARIAFDIESELAKLSSAGAARLGACFAPPSLGLSYDVQKAVFAAVDPSASGIAYAAADARNTVASVMNNSNDIIHTAFSDAVFSIIPKPTAQNAGSAFAVEKALYGSSLSEQDYEALLGGQDIPEVTPTPSQPPTAQAVSKPVPQPQPQPTQSKPLEERTVPAAPIPTQVSISPGFGGGSSPVSEKMLAVIAPTISTTSTSTQNEQQQTASTTEPQDISQTAATTTATTTLPFSIVSPTNGTIFSTSTGAFSGTTSAKVTVLVTFATSSASTTSDAGGNWSFSLVLPEGTSTIFASAFDSFGDSSPTSTLTVSVELPAIVATSTVASSQTTSLVKVPPQNPCGNSTLSAGGYFFSTAKDDAEYSAAGFLEYHFEDLPQYSDGRPFKLTWQFFDDQCSVSGPQTEPKLTITLPAKVTDWSARFTSLMHLDVWDDPDNSIVASYDIPARMPDYTSAEFNASVDGNASTLVSRGLQIFKSGEVPSFSGSLSTPQGCPAGSANGYFFDSYEHAEYVGGLLRIHLRLLSPYNDGRLFLAGVESEQTCSFTYPRLAGIPQTSLTPYIRYFSFRMISPTHWVLWDDENDIQIFCVSGCEGDIPAANGYVSFYASVDAGASTLHTGAYAPTGG